MAYGYVAFGEPRRALKLSLQLENLLGNYHPRLDLRWANRLLNLVIAVDLEEAELIKKYYHSCYRFLYCRNLSPGYCGKFIYSLYCINRQPLLERKAYYNAELAKVEVALQDQSKARTMIYFDGLTWLKGKRRGLTICEVNKERGTKKQS